MLIFALPDSRIIDECKGPAVKMVSEMLESKGDAIPNDVGIHMMASQITCEFIVYLLSLESTSGSSACVLLSSMPVFQLYHDVLLALVLISACPNSFF